MGRWVQQYNSHIVYIPLPLTHLPPHLLPLTHLFILLKDGAEFARPGERGLVEGDIIRRECVHIQQVAQLLQGGLWREYHKNGFQVTSCSAQSPPTHTHTHTHLHSLPEFSNKIRPGSLHVRNEVHHLSRVFWHPQGTDTKLLILQTDPERGGKVKHTFTCVR